MKIARLCALLVVTVLLCVFLGALMKSIAFGVVAGLALAVAIGLAAKHLEARDAKRS